ncbi:transcriptional regulator [Escherichia coli]|uniref:Transcriptional regulator n=1 Tax=Escherichia coli TaxID=562 RepID=A0A376TKE7_ECOLX|nr:transcriptional regulator [Escherichia coli]
MKTLFNIRDMNAYHRGMVTLACIPTAVFYFFTAGNR